MFIYKNLLNSEIMHCMLNIVNGFIMKITQAAEDRIKQLLMNEKENALFRVSVIGGGCSGFQYRFTIDWDDNGVGYGDISDMEQDDLEPDDFYREKQEDEDDDDDDTRDDDDVLIEDFEDDASEDGENDNIIFKARDNMTRIVISDKKSLLFLENATLDYINSLAGSKFKVINQEAKSGCGCGNSFSM